MQNIGLKRLELRPLCWHSRTERGFSGARACMPEAAQPQVASPPEKPCAVREVWQSQTCARSRLSLARQRKRGLRRRTSFCEVKTKPSLEGFVLTKLKQDLCKRACFYAAKRVPCAGMRRKGEQGINEGRLPEIWQTASNTTKSELPASLALMFSGSLKHRQKAT